MTVYYRGTALRSSSSGPRTSTVQRSTSVSSGGLDSERRAELTHTESYGQATVDARGAHPHLPAPSVGRLMKAFREVARREELTVGPASPADSPPPARVPAAGRPVTDHHMHRRLDLLGLRRLGERARAGSWSSRSSEVHGRPALWQREHPPPAASLSSLCRGAALATLRDGMNDTPEHKGGEVVHYESPAISSVHGEIAPFRDHVPPSVGLPRRVGLHSPGWALLRKYAKSP